MSCRYVTKTFMVIDKESLSRMTATVGLLFPFLFLVRCQSFSISPTLYSITRVIYTIDNTCSDGQRKEQPSRATINRLVSTHSGQQRTMNNHHVYSQFQSHSIMNLIVLECDVILVNSVPLLDLELLGPCAQLGGG